MKNIAANLKNMTPMDAEYTLSTGETYTVRKFTLEDNVWIGEQYGEDKDSLQKALSSAIEMARVAFHQMPMEQKKLFTPKEFEVSDEDTGEINTVKIGGWKLFAKSIPNSVQDVQAISNALVKALVGSNPIIDKEAEKSIEAENEQPYNSKKKKPIGLKSSI